MGEVLDGAGIMCAVSNAGDRLLPSNVQCVNCGSYKVLQEWNWYNAASNRAVPKSSWRNIVIVALGFPIVACALKPWWAPDESVFALAPWILLVVGVLALVMELQRRFLVARSVRVWRYRCETCGYQWTWVEGDRWPPAPPAAPTHP